MGSGARFLQLKASCIRQCDKALFRLEAARPSVMPDRDSARRDAGRRAEVRRSPTGKCHEDTAESIEREGIKILPMIIKARRVAYLPASGIGS